MGRELRRVPLDFNWPLKKVWSGYLNPHYKKCDACDGRGNTFSYQYLEGIVRLLMLAGECGLGHRNPRVIYPHLWLQETPTLQGLRPPTQELTDLTDRLAGRRAIDGCAGYDSGASWSAMKKIIEAAGLPKKLGYCKECKGHGIDPAMKKQYNRWRSKHPPKGKGYQLWETTSEGSPVSPVFGTLEELCSYAEKHCTTFADHKVSAEQWREMLDANFVCHKQGNAVFI